MYDIVDFKLGITTGKDGVLRTVWFPALPIFLQEAR